MNARAFRYRLSNDRAVRALRRIGTALDRGDLAAARAAEASFDRAFPGIGRPVAVKPSKRGRRG